MHYDPDAVKSFFKFLMYGELDRFSISDSFKYVKLVMGEECVNPNLEDYLFDDEVEVVCYYSKVSDRITDIKIKYFEFRDDIDCFSKWAYSFYFSFKNIKIEEFETILDAMRLSYRKLVFDDGGARIELKYYFGCVVFNNDRSIDRILYIAPENRSFIFSPISIQEFSFD